MWLAAMNMLIVLAEVSRMMSSDIQILGMVAFSIPQAYCLGGVVDAANQQECQY